MNKREGYRMSTEAERAKAAIKSTAEETQRLARRAAITGHLARDPELFAKVMRRAKYSPIYCLNGQYTPPSAELEETWARERDEAYEAVMAEAFEGAPARTVKTPFGVCDVTESDPRPTVPDTKKWHRFSFKDARDNVFEDVDLKNVPDGPIRMLGVDTPNRYRGVFDESKSYSYYELRGLIENVVGPGKPLPRYVLCSEAFAKRCGRSVWGVAVVGDPHCPEGCLYPVPQSLEPQMRAYLDKSKVEHNALRLADDIAQDRAYLEKARQDREREALAVKPKYIDGRTHAEIMRCYTENQRCDGTWHPYTLTPAQKAFAREAWSAQLRVKTETVKTEEKNRIVCEPNYEDDNEW